MDLCSSSFWQNEHLIKVEVRARILESLRIIICILPIYNLVHEIMLLRLETAADEAQRQTPAAARTLLASTNFVDKATLQSLIEVRARIS